MSQAIVKLHADVRPEDLQNYLNNNRDDRISDKDVLDYLTDLKKWNALAILYRNNREPRKALEIWQQLGLKQKEDPTSNPVEETVKFLSKSSDMSLLRDFSKWVYDVDYKAFKSIFKREKTSEPLPHQFVIAFLDTIEQYAKRFYLNYLVYTLGTKDPNFHNQLAELYLNSILNLIQKSKILSSRLTAMESGLEEGTAQGGKTRVERQKENQMSRQRAQSMITEEEKLLKLRRKFLKLLHSSLYLNYASLLPRIKDTDLRYEKIELYNIAGKHEDALREILRMSEEDPTRAENYCLQYKEPTRYDQGYNENARAGMAYFNPALGHNPRLLALLKIHIDNKKYKEATDLLKRYPSLFNPVEIINVLPPSIPICDVSDFLINSIKQTMHQYHLALATKNIENATHLMYLYDKKKSRKLTSKSIVKRCAR